MDGYGRIFASILVAVVAIAVIALFVFQIRQATKALQIQTPALAEPTSVITYACGSGRTMQASYFGDGDSNLAVIPRQLSAPSSSIRLALSDGRDLHLVQVASAEPDEQPRYSNSDGSFIFWSKNNAAFTLENGLEGVYAGCVAVAPRQPGQDLPQIYVSSSAGFSIRYPSDYRLDETHRYQSLGPDTHIAGVKFTIPASLADGTNLSSDSYISVERMPEIQTCTADAFLEQGTVARTVIEGDATYSASSATGAAAGNRYEETVYALPDTKPCVAVRYFIHYGVLENYPAGTVREFDKQALLEEFDAIRRTLVLAG